MDCVVWQVSASKTKIYMVLEYVNGGELFDKIVRIMDLPNLLHFGRICRGDTKIPRWLSPGAKKMLGRILDPNPVTRINVAGIRADDWFKKDYSPAVPYDFNDDDDDLSLYGSLPIKEVQNVLDGNGTSPVNAFELIGMSSSLDLSGFFENEDVSERKIRFTSTHSPKDLSDKIAAIVTEMGLEAQKGHGKVSTLTDFSDTIPYPD
ncbi:hypothetical protein GW17_00050365 [Ensete ventricosum]|nr:hypothetical protein GW17_00050365 [Ensete ventricosum]